MFSTIPLLTETILATKVHKATNKRLNSLVYIVILNVNRVKS